MDLERLFEWDCYIPMGGFALLYFLGLLEETMILSEEKERRIRLNILIYYNLSLFICIWAGRGGAGRDAATATKSID